MGRVRRLLGRWSLASRLGRVRLLVLDVDGVLTDGGLWYGPEGEPTKRFDVRDGLGIKLLQRAGLEVALLSGGRGGATERRAGHLGIRHCLVGATDKAAALAALQRDLGLEPEVTAFVGDDYNDLTVRPRVGLLVATADAALGLRRQADLVLGSRGGHGAVREMAERLLRGTRLWSEVNGEGWRERND